MHCFLLNFGYFRYRSFGYFMYRSFGYVVCPIFWFLRWTASPWRLGHLWRLRLVLVGRLQTVNGNVVSLVSELQGKKSVSYTHLTLPTKRIV